MRTRRGLIGWIAGGAVLLIAVVFGGIAAVNITVYSPAGTVQAYFDDLARGDAASALARPGVAPSGLRDAQRVLLDGAAFTGPTKVSVHTDKQSGSHATVTATYDIAEKTYTHTFTLTKTATPVFDEWRFDESPLASLTVSVQHGIEFQVGRLGAVDISAYPGGDAGLFQATATFPAFSGVSYRVFRDRPLITAPAVTVAVTEPGEVVEATIVVEPTKKFVSSVQQGIDDALNKCLTQKVLMPTDCPFGFTTTNRFLGDATWTMPTYPELTLTPGNESWLVTGQGTAHVTGQIQSLYDGTVTDVSEDAPFGISMRAWALDNGTRVDIRP